MLKPDPSPWPVRPQKYYPIPEEPRVFVDGVQIWVHWCHANDRYIEHNIDESCPWCGAPDDEDDPE